MRWWQELLYLKKQHGLTISRDVSPFTDINPHSKKRMEEQILIDFIKSDAFKKYQMIIKKKFELEKDFREEEIV